jgi:multisubunit Na+/H+ antiporter MnhE subunit
MEYINAIISSILELHWEKIQSAIDWANVFAGAIVGLILVYLPHILKFTFLLFKDKYKDYYGRYYLYGYYLIQDEKKGKKVNTVTIDIKILFWWRSKS